MVLPTFTRMLSITTDTPPTEVKQIIHNLVFPSHPEHYQLIVSDKPGVTETWGGIPTRSDLDVPLRRRLKWCNTGITAIRLGSQLVGISG